LSRARNFYSITKGGYEYISHPYEQGKKHMNGTTVKSAIEHLSGILDSFATGDLDSFSYDGLASAITALESFSNINNSNDDLQTILGLVASITSHFYVSRGHAAMPDIPRHFDYYQNMLSARRLIQQINKMK
jgi:hypothetical protein